MSSALSSSDVTAVVSRSLQQLERVRARASEHARRTADITNNANNNNNNNNATSSDGGVISAISAAEHAQANEEVAERVARITQRSGEFVQVLANEPSVGLYHVHEHVLRCLPKWTELHAQLVEHTATLERHRLDVEYSVGVVNQIVALQSFAGLAALSRRSLQLAEQLRAAPPSSTRRRTTETVSLPSNNNSNNQ
jgi:hypothetical protein